jgi:hypothetical protein
MNFNVQLREKKLLADFSKKYNFVRALSDYIRSILREREKKETTIIWSSKTFKGKIIVIYVIVTRTSFKVFCKHHFNLNSAKFQTPLKFFMTRKI